MHLTFSSHNIKSKLMQFLPNKNENKLLLMMTEIFNEENLLYVFATKLL